MYKVYIFYVQFERFVNIIIELRSQSTSMYFTFILQVHYSSSLSIIFITSTIFAGSLSVYQCHKCSEGYPRNFFIQEERIGKAVSTSH